MPSHSDAKRFFQALAETGHLVHEYAQKTFFTKTDITMHQFIILKKLIKHGGSVDTIAQIWCQHHTSRGNLTGLIERMRVAGYLEVVDAPEDRRKRIIMITTKGRDKVEAIEAIMHEHIPWFLEATRDIPIVNITHGLEQIMGVLKGKNQSEK